MEKTIIELEKPFIDDRGTIQKILESHSGSCVIISSVKGSQRANHYHKEDYHYCYLVSGSIEYFERPVGSDELPVKYIINPGVLFFTGPMIEHTMYFTEDSVFITFGGGTRTQADYEDDLVRVASLKD